MTQPSRTRVRLLWILALAGVYFVAGTLGLRLAFLNASATAVWAPTGIALAAVLVLGPWVWPGIAIGAFLVNATTSGSVPVSAAIAVGNTLEALAGGWLVNRWANGSRAYESALDIARYALVAGMVAPVVSATIGVTSLWLAGLAPSAQYSQVWLTWWLGDASSAIVVTPVLLLMTTSPVRWAASRYGESVLFAALFVGVVLAVFGGRLPISGGNYPLSFMCMPLLAWPALRLGRRETALSGLGLAAAAILGTLRGYGPFGSEPHHGLILAQTFAGVASVTSAMIAALVDEANRLNDQLEGRVAERTEQLRVINDDLRAQITERERLHSALKASEARLTDAQTVAHVGSWEWDMSGDAVWWSEELYRIYGLSPQSFAASYQGFIERVHPDDRELMHAAVLASLKEGRPFEVEHRVIRPDGTERMLAARGRVVLGEQGEPIRMMGTGQDVTDRKRAEEDHLQLMHEQVARRQAEEASRLKDQFLAVVSHELRTPLNAVLGWARMLADGNLDAESTRRAVHVIERNAQAQARLIDDLLDVSKFLAGQTSLERRLVEIEPAVRAALEAVEPVASPRGIKINARVQSSGTRVQADPQRLEQIVLNLLANAVKFTPDGGNVAVDVTTTPACVEIRVSDSGQGIDPSELELVFEPFWQADKTHTRTHGGLGLGLAIVRHLVVAHGGSVRAVSDGPGLGSAFVVELPLGSAEVEAQG
jgi:PAS domain S-box-containing protein